MAKQGLSSDPEFLAMGTVYEALFSLNSEAQLRVLHYVSERLNLAQPLSNKQSASADEEEHKDEAVVRHRQDEESGSASDGDELEGISPAGKKWIARSGFKAGDLASIFSLGIDEIDLVAEKVPGTGKKERMRNVYLLKGMASYLGTGVASFTQAQVKEVLLHYDAFDTKNFAAYFASMSAEVSGSKETGYTLSPRGISNATTLLKSMMKQA